MSLYLVPVLESSIIKEYLGKITKIIVKLKGYNS